MSRPIDEDCDTCGSKAGQECRLMPSDNRILFGSHKNRLAKAWHDEDRRNKEGLYR